MTKYRSEAIKRCEDLAEDARVRAEQLADLVMDFESELEMLIEDLDASDYVSAEGFAEWVDSYADIEIEMITMEDYISSRQWIPHLRLDVDVKAAGCSATPQQPRPSPGVRHGTRGVKYLPAKNGPQHRNP